MSASKKVWKWARGSFRLNEQTEKKATKKSEMSLRKHLDLGRQIFPEWNPREISGCSIYQRNDTFRNSRTRKRNIFMIKVCCLVICLSWAFPFFFFFGGYENYPFVKSQSRLRSSPHHLHFSPFFRSLSSSIYLNELIKKLSHAKRISNV